MTEPVSVADPKALKFLRNADPVLARVIDAHPDFHPRAWLDELPPLDAFGTLVFQVIGQQLSVRATRTILGRLEQHFGGRLPSPAELLAVDPQALRDSGMSARKGATLRAVAERFVDGRLSDEALSRMPDDEVEAALTEVPGIGPWTARNVAPLRADMPLSRSTCASAASSSDGDGRCPPKRSSRRERIVRVAGTESCCPTTSKTSVPKASSRGSSSIHARGRKPGCASITRARTGSALRRKSRAVGSATAALMSAAAVRSRDLDCAWHRWTSRMHL